MPGSTNDRDKHLSELIKAAKGFNLKDSRKHVDGLMEWLEHHVALSPQEYLKAVEDSLARKDVELLAALVKQLLQLLQSGDAHYCPEDAITILEALKRRGAFDSVTVLADGFLAYGIGGLTLRRLYAHSLIETGKLEPAISMLNELAVDAEAVHDVIETSEAYGLLGRCYKQRYFDSLPKGRETKAREAVKENLINAIDYYWTFFTNRKFYDLRDRTWHGINVASLARIAKQDEVEISSDIVAEDIAAEVYEQVLARIPDHLFSGCRGTKVNHWDYATLAEAQVVLGNYCEALSLISLFTQENHERARYASTLRQFEQVFETRFPRCGAGKNPAFPACHAVEQQ